MGLCWVARWVAVWLDGKPAVLAGELTEWLCWVWLQLHVVGGNLSDWLDVSLGCGSMLLEEKSRFWGIVGWLAGSLGSCVAGCLSWLASWLAGCLC